MVIRIKIIIYTYTQACLHRYMDKYTYISTHGFTYKVYFIICICKREL